MTQQFQQGECMSDTIKIAVLALLRHEIEQLRDEPEEAELADEDEHLPCWLREQAQ